MSKMIRGRLGKAKFNKNIRSVRGVTLVELIVTLMVLAILVGIALPTFERTVRSNRLVAETHELLGNLNLARSEATRRGVNVTVCPSADGNACGTDWSSGWLMAVDTADGNNPPALGEILRRGGSRVPVTGPASNRIRFDPTGGLVGAGVETIELHDGVESEYRCVNIALTGRVRSEPGACPSS